MSWSNAKNFGVIKCEGKQIKLYSSRDNYNILAIHEEVRDARWAGDALVVYLASGKVRRYTSMDNYTFI